MLFSSELDGAWEEPGVIGTRIEISGKKINVLWRNSSVLETTFKTAARDGGRELCLKEKGVRNKGDAKPYADITGLFYKDGVLELTEFFPISGESKTLMKKTAHSRFGNYEIANEMLKELQGKWKDRDGIFELTIKKDVLTLTGKERKIVVLKSGSPEHPEYTLADSDPSAYEFGDFTRFRYEGGVLRTKLIMFDAPSPIPDTVFEKVK